MRKVSTSCRSRWDRVFVNLTLCGRRRYCSPTAADIMDNKGATGAAPGGSALSSADLETLKAPERNTLAPVKSFLEALTDASSSAKAGSSGSALSTLVGHAASDRFFHNKLVSSKPWEASCVEIRSSAASSKEDLGGPNFERLRKKEEEGDTDPCDANGDADAAGDVDVVFYYETSLSDGLKAYKHIARLVMLGHLPGSVENHMCTRGYATWSIPRAEYFIMLNPAAALDAGIDGNLAKTDDQPSAISTSNVEVDSSLD